MTSPLPLFAALALLAMPAQAERVRVQSGEHPTFSRLVLQLAAPTGWQLGRTESGYELRLARDDVELDLRRVFELIPRRRILDVAAPEATGTLALSVAPETYASAFELKPGTIVLDIFNGTAPAASRFEAMLDAPATLEPVAAPPPAPTLALPLRPAAGTSTPDPLLNHYWANVAVVGREAPVAEPLPDIGGAAAADPRIMAAEEQLLRQLGRAASQGLVILTLPELAPSAPPAAEPAPRETLSSAEPLATLPETHLALRSETVFDRDANPGAATRLLNPDGLACLPDTAINVAAWAGDTPVAVQLGSAQAGLLGEFDRPSPSAVLGLVRLYIALGMGAEVSALIDGLRLELPDEDVLRDMAAVVDDLSAHPAGRIAQMADCDAQVALWAVLANSTLRRGDRVNVNAVLRSFSMLPLNLRLLLGPRLTDRLIALGAESAARTLRDAISRAPGDHGATIGLIDAGIEMARGEPAAAATALAPMIAENGPDAPRAMVLSIESRLASGENIDPASLEAVAALAYEHREAPDGPALARAHVLAAGSAGQFERAFDALARMPATATSDDIATTTTALMHQLAATPDDVNFATQYFRSRDLVLRQNDWPLKIQTAERLLVLGFAAEARRVLGPEAVRLDAGRLLRARAAVQEGEGAAALAEIAGVTGDDASWVRADALRLVGEHAAAQRAYLLVDAVDQAGAEAWQAGIWPEVARFGSPAQRTLVAALGLSPNGEAAAVEPPGPLAASRSLLEASRGARAALDLVLAETADD
ncbi:MAG: hypothetical protein Q8Q63_15925 [Phaeovulum sp.]|uniref:hypothetical protein n=1 Tax=Phaeovulum sp. TaxID=2934796 RepID=UPI0027370152|nr:hypothetical protein [Phaeovulum sp.]MDP3863062.1 hypothetical protein [Phaeovulum sp.]